MVVVVLVLVLVLVAVGIVFSVRIGGFDFRWSTGKVEW